VIERTGNRPLTVQYVYQENGLQLHLKGAKADLPSFAELLAIVDAKIATITAINTINRIETIRNPYWEVTADTPFVERWEFLSDILNRRDVFFSKYQGRIGAVWQVEAQLPEKDWSLPNFVLDLAALADPLPWRNVIDMTNRLNGVLSEVYFAVRRSYTRARMRITCITPAAVNVPLGAELLFGFEVVSQGGHAIVMVEVSNATATFLWRTIGEDGAYPTGGWTSVNVTATFGFNAWTTYLLEYDPPVARLSKYAGGVYVLMAEMTVPELTSSDRLMPFFANEGNAALTGYYINHIAVSALSHSGSCHKLQTWVNPGADPSLDFDVGGRLHVEVWARSITAGKTVLVQGSADRTTWRDIEEVLTVALNGLNQVHIGYFNAYRFVKVTVEENGAGTEAIEITATGE